MPHHRRQVRALERQADFFSTPRPETAATLHWSSLPESTQHTVTALITRLLVMHAADAAPQLKDDADER